MKDEGLKQLKELLKDELRPIKDMVELTKRKIDSLETSMHFSAENTRRVKEQQSLMNEKMDNLTESLVTLEQIIKDLKVPHFSE